MKSIITLVLLIGFSFSIRAQDFVVNDSTSTDSIKKVLTIIPFQNNYYHSEVDRALAINEELNFNQLRDRLRNELDRQLYSALKENFDIISFLKEDTEEEREMMNYIFYSTASQYTQVGNDEEVNRRLLANGQLVETSKPEGKTYMKTIIHHPPLLQTMKKANPSDWFLFIGELDILLPKNIDENKNLRNINVHYTLFDSDMMVLDSGVISETIPAKKCKHIKDISALGFAAIAIKLKDKFSLIQ
jgi:hypothetical protein